MRKSMRIVSIMLLAVMILTLGISTASAANMPYTAEQVKVYTNGQFVILDLDQSPYYCDKVYPNRGWVNKIDNFEGSYLNSGVCMGLRLRSTILGSRDLSPAEHTLTNQLWFRDEGKKTGTFKQNGHTGYMRVIARQDDRNGTHVNYISGYYNSDASA